MLTFAQIIHRIQREELQDFCTYPDNGFLFRKAVSDDDGHIRFVVKGFIGTDEIIVKTDNRKDSVYALVVTGITKDGLAVSSISTFSVTRSPRQ